MCQAGQENFCYEGPVSTYGGTDRVDGTGSVRDDAVMFTVIAVVGQDRFAGRLTRRSLVLTLRYRR
jgi:hypothetical protein